MVTFVDRIISKKGHLIHKLHAQDTTGQQAYYFLLVEPHKESPFFKALETSEGTINLTKYGKVVASCYGDQPTEETKKTLKDRFGFDIYQHCNPKPLNL